MNKEQGLIPVIVIDTGSLSGSVTPCINMFIITCSGDHNEDGLDFAVTQLGG